jgi:FKBP-type peptidyl-prolyl cis-trans isomerase FklB
MPEYNDSIRMHYQGRLIPSMSYPQGRVFGKSYTNNTLNEAYDVPALMAVNSNVVGFATAAMNMVEGDAWKIVVPYTLGYGVTNYTSANIPGYSTLIFDIKLARIYKYKIDKDTTWH